MVGFENDQIGVVKAVREKRHALKRGQKMHGEGLFLAPLSERAELRLNPGQQFNERTRSQPREVTAILVEFGAEGAYRTPPPCKRAAILHCHLNEGQEPLLGVIRLLPTQPHRLEFLEALCHDGLANLRLGLEIVIHIAQRDSRLSGYVGERRVAEATLIRQLGGGLNQSRSFVYRGLGHDASLSVNQLSSDLSQTCSPMSTLNGWSSFV